MSTNKMTQVDLQDKTRWLEKAGKGESTVVLENKRHTTVSRLRWIAMVVVFVGLVGFGFVSHGNTSSHLLKRDGVDTPTVAPTSPRLFAEQTMEVLSQPASETPMEPAMSIVETLVPMQQMPTISIASPPKKLQAQAPWKMGKYSCLRSCEDDGFVLVAVEGESIHCLGGTGGCSWFQTPFCSQPKPGQALPNGQIGATCELFESGWCKEAHRVLVMKEDPTRCARTSSFVAELDDLLAELEAQSMVPRAASHAAFAPERTPAEFAANTISTVASPTPESTGPGIASADGPGIAAADTLDPTVQIAGDVKPSAWKCIYACHEEAYVLVRDTGMGSIQCSGQNSLGCTWYDDDECRSVSESSLPPVSHRGMMCKRFWPGTWCAEAQSQLWYKNLQSDCYEKHEDSSMPEEYTCVQSCTDRGDYVRVHEEDDHIACQGPNDASCSWYEDAECTRLNAGANPPDGTHGRPCSQDEMETPGTWCSNYKAVKAGNDTDCMPEDYGCIVSCKDGGAAVRVRARDLRCAGDLPGGKARCTWYTDKSCTQRAPGGRPPVEEGGRACVPKDFVEGFWCHAAKKILWDGEAPLACADIPPPPPVHWTCMQSCANQGAYIQVRHGGWSVGITCNGANNNCTLYGDAKCTLQVAASSPPVPFQGYRCKDWDMLTGWCREAKSRLAGSPPFVCSQVQTFAVVASASDAQASSVASASDAQASSVAAQPTNTIVETF